MSKILEEINKPNKNLAYRLLGAFLFGISFFYRLVIFIRNKAFDKGFIKSHQSKAYVISVGNIVAGGTGKSPFILHLVKKLLDKKLKIAILSRGYKSKLSLSGKSTIISKGSGPLYNANECGDEPFMISKKTPQAIFVIGKSRVESERLIQNENCDIILLDDGFQHRYLKRDLDILILDASDPFGKNHLLPRGLLREPKSSLKRADFVILNRVENLQSAKDLCLEVKKYTSAQIIKTQVESSYAINLSTSKPFDLKNKKIAAFCAIGNPSSFYAELLKHGVDLVYQKSFIDHESLDKKELDKLFSIAIEQGAEAIVCTEKDAVKIDIEALDLAIPLLSLPIELKVVDGQKNLDQILQDIKLKV